MSPCPSIAELLPLSAAGVLPAAEERAVREHVRECPACAARLEALGELARSLSAMPQPAVPPDLAIRTQARLAAELEAAADRRRGGFLALAGAALAWISWFGLWDLYRAVTEGFAALLRPQLPSLWICLAVSAIMAALAAPIAAALQRVRRGERSAL